MIDMRLVLVGVAAFALYIWLSPEKPRVSPKGGNDDPVLTMSIEQANALALCRAKVKELVILDQKSAIDAPPSTVRVSDYGFDFNWHTNYRYNVTWKDLVTVRPFSAFCMTRGQKAIDVLNVGEANYIKVGDWK